MAQIIGLPKLSPTMEEGVIAKWHKKEGDKISPGDIVAEVETDKANMDFPIEDEGTLLKLLVKEGETVKLGAPVAILGEQGEDVSQLLQQAAGGAGGGAGAEASKPAATQQPTGEPAPAKEAAKAAPAAPAATAAAEKSPQQQPQQQQPQQQQQPSQPQPQKAAQSSPPAPTPIRPAAPPQKASPPAPVASSPRPAPPQPAGRSILASPLAKTLAAENGIDLRSVRGTGPGGRIVERDVKTVMQGGGASGQAGAATASSPAPAAASAPAPAAAPAEAEAPAEEAQAEPAPQQQAQKQQAPGARAPTTQAPASSTQGEGDEFVDKSLSLMRKTIARRLSESKQTIPHFYLTGTCDAKPLGAFREALNVVLGDDGKITLNDLVIKAAAIALRKVPTANASFLGDRIRYHGRVHIGVAVSIEDGLITPVIRDADQKSLRALSSEVKDLAGRARQRKLTPEEMSGGTFTISNLGMFGVDHFEAIINPPEGAILAVGTVRKVPVVESHHDGEDKVVIGQRMALSLSCDHRVVDGVLGAKLLAAIVDILEHPAALAL